MHFNVLCSGNLDTAIINCSACHRQIGSDTGSAVHRHPVLKVLICKVSSAFISCKCWQSK